MSKIIYFGSDNFGVPSLEELKKKHTISAVVTAPDKPKGRGLKLSFTPVKEWALNNKIPVLQPNCLYDRDFISRIKKIYPEFIVLISYGKILPCQILEVPSVSAVNVHPSLLPAYRGAAPMEWALINGEKETGITVMAMQCQMDAGGIIKQKKFVIKEKDDIFSLRKRLSEAAPKLLIKGIELLNKGEHPSPQRGKPTYARKLEKKDGLICWEKSAEEIKNLIRGAKEWPGAYTYLCKKYTKIFHAEPGIKEKGKKDGEVISVEGCIVVSCGNDTTLKIFELQTEGRKKMPAVEFLKGCKIEPGIRLTTCQRINTHENSC